MKPLFIISCPIDTYSGYGARSRDIVKSIIELDKYEVKVLSQRWGNTPWGFIKDHKDKWGFLIPHILTNPSLPRQPDIWAQISVPNEFQPVGKFNIGFTAGIETTVCAPQWIEGLNRMDLNIVSSEHAKTTFDSSKFEKQNSQNQKIGVLELEKPVKVLFEGVDLETYLPKKSEFDLSSVEEDFAYLFVGHWMQGDLGEDRKDVGMLVKVFLETFKNKKKTPSLILKTSGGGSSYMDREHILDKIDQIRNTVEATKLPNIYLLHGEFTDKEINELYNHNKVKAMISLTKGEGFGRPLLEFSLTKKPIITSNWSGQTDYLDPEFTNLIEGELKNVDKSALVKDIIVEEGKWFTANYGSASYYLKDIFENYKPYKEKAVRQAYKSKTQFSYEAMRNELESILDSTVPNFAEEVALKLPSLDKIKLPELTKV